MGYDGMVSITTAPFLGNVERDCGYAYSRGAQKHLRDRSVFEHL